MGTGAVQWVADVHAVSPSCVFAGNVKAMAAGSRHSLVLKTDGTVWAMGENQFGQLGDGSNNDKKPFVQVDGTWDTALGNTLSIYSSLSVRLPQTLALER